MWEERFWYMCAGLDLFQIHLKCFLLVLLKDLEKMASSCLDWVYAQEPGRLCYLTISSHIITKSLDTERSLGKFPKQTSYSLVCLLTEMRQKMII